jgi:opacity protein-like surface antigen
VMILLCLSYDGGNVYASEEEWQFELTPYIWAAGVDVDTTTVKGRQATGEFEFGDILDNLDFAGSIHFEGWKEKWGFIFDAFYVDLGTEARLTPRIGPKIDADIDVRQTSIELAAGYRIPIDTRAAEESGSSGKQAWKFWVEPLAGLRYGGVKEEIDLRLSFTRLQVIGEPERTFEDYDWWIEPFAGMRFVSQYKETLTFFVRGDIGGISVDDESVFSWHAIGGFDYEPWETVSFKLGYRVYDFDYENDDGQNKFELNARQHGPILGVSFHF